jgi:glycosyltransferase involved in cell wall biosynthesis
MLRNANIAARHYLAGGRENGGGIGRLVGYLVDAAAAEGARHAVTDTRGPRLSPRSAGRLVASLTAMTRDRLVAPERIHHIHVAGRGSTWRKLVLCAAARTFGCAHVLHLHDYDYASDFIRRPRWQQALVRRMFQRADRVVVLGRRDRETATGLLGVDVARLSVLGNCVPDPGPRTTPDRAVPKIVFLGQLGTRKGVPELLAALASPEMSARTWQATVAGDGPVDDFRRAADALGLSGRVVMPGWVSEPEARRLCADADILVLPSRQEGMAMAVLEGLAHGLAVVTTPVGAHDEAITDGETGVFVPVGDAAALAAALARLVDDPAERQRLSAAARARYLADFSMEGYLRGLRSIYAGLSGVRAAGPAAPSRAEERPT